MQLKDDVVTISHGSTVALYDITTFDLLRSHTLPCIVNSASLHCDKVGSGCLCFFETGKYKEIGVTAPAAAVYLQYICSSSITPTGTLYYSLY